MCTYLINLIYGMYVLFFNICSQSGLCKRATQLKYKNIYTEEERNEVEHGSRLRSAKQQAHICQLQDGKFVEI